MLRWFFPPKFSTSPKYCDFPPPFFTEFTIICSVSAYLIFFFHSAMIVSLLRATETMFSVAEKMFDQVTVQMKAATCRLQYIGRGIWRLHVLCLKCQVPGCDSAKIGTGWCQHPSVSGV